MKSKLKIALLALIAIFACTELATQATAAKRKTKQKTKQTTSVTKKKKEDTNTSSSDPTFDLIEMLFRANSETFYDGTCVTKEVNGVKFDMIFVSGGTFQMGTTNEEEPVHSVTLSSYFIGKTEVTQRLWKAVMGSNPSHFKGDNLPVECVSWYDCQEFIKRLNALTGENFRLPTEAEWEFACRGGNKSQGYKYSGSNDIEKVGWNSENSGWRTHPVGSKKCNELGIYDMSGNVSEWCADWYGDYSSDSQTNPTGPTSGSKRISRGGCWQFYESIATSTCRFWNVKPEYDNWDLGFRIVL